MSTLLKPLRSLLNEEKPIIEVDVAEQIVTLDIMPDEIFYITNLYSFVNLTGKPIIYSLAPIDPHPEVWNDPRWTKTKDYVLGNQGELCTDIQGERIFSTAKKMFIRTNGKSRCRITLRGAAL